MHFHPRLYIIFPVSLLGIVLIVPDNTLQESIDRVIGYVNTQNQLETSTLTLVAGGIASGTAVIGHTRLQIMSNIDGKDCSESNPACQMDSSQFPAMWDAVQQKTGEQETKDYDGVPVLSAYAYSEDLNLGFVLKQELGEVQKPQIVQLFILLGTALGISIIGAFIEFVAARYMLRSLEEGWNKSREAVLQQKESFERLVGALYPKFVSDRLMNGDSLIVVEVPEVYIRQLSFN